MLRTTHVEENIPGSSWKLVKAAGNRMKSLGILSLLDTSVYKTLAIKDAFSNYTNGGSGLLDP